MFNLWKYSKWVNLYNNQYTYVFWNNLVATAVTALKLTLLVFTVRSHLLPAGLNPASTTPSVRMKMGTTPAFAGQVTKIELICVNWNIMLLINQILNVFIFIKKVMHVIGWCIYTCNVHSFEIMLNKLDKPAHKTGLSSHICSVPGFEGHNCETDVSECDSSPCVNEGICIERSWKTLYGTESLFPPRYNPRHASGFICKCPPGFSGICRLTSLFKLLNYTLFTKCDIV